MHRALFLALAVTSAGALPAAAQTVQAIRPVAMNECASLAIGSTAELACEQARPNRPPFSLVGPELSQDRDYRPDYGATLSQPGRVGAGVGASGPGVLGEGGVR
jgi:hypothetical protein